MDGQTILFIAQAALLLVIIGGLLHRLFRDYGRRKVTEKAVLVHKRTAAYRKATHFDALDHPEQTDYLLEFRTVKRHLTFSVDGLLYDRAVEGKTYRITRKGQRLLSLDPA